MNEKEPPHFSEGPSGSAASSRGCRWMRGALVQPATGEILLAEVRFSPGDRVALSRLRSHTCSIRFAAWTIPLQSSVQSLSHSTPDFPVCPLAFSAAAQLAPASVGVLCHHHDLRDIEKPPVAVLRMDPAFEIRNLSFDF